MTGKYANVLIISTWIKFYPDPRTINTFNMEVQIKIARQRTNIPLYFQTYTLEVDPGNTILECLNKIKWEQDGSLAFRKNCRNTICGSCGMKINGRSALACKENIGNELTRLQQIAQSSTDYHPKNTNQTPEIIISPLGNMPVIKDLVVNMSDFWENLEKIDPYISSKGRQVPEREFLQTPKERSLLDQTGNCILCGACYSECNAVEVNENFVGPHALAKGYRMVKDSRDSQTESRIEKYNNSISGVWSCTRCFQCNNVCPMNVAPLDQISKIKQEILTQNDENASRAIRHRKVLVDLVKQGGWIDERKFGIRVIGDNYQDVKGLLSLGPLGLRMLAKGKFPFSFLPSEGIKEIRSLIESVFKIENDEKAKL